MRFVGSVMIGYLALLLMLVLSVPVRGDDDFESQMLPLVQKYCFECHSDGEENGSVDLGAYTSLPQVVRDVQLWEDIATVIDAGEMPPSEAKQMTDDERMVAIAWINRLIEQVNAAGQVDIEPITPRRLTRPEYVNTVRDLLGVQIDAETFLPEDKVGATGFRNAATELMVPAELLEKYMMLAQKVVGETIQADASATTKRLMHAEPRGGISGGTGGGIGGKAAARQIIRDFGKRAFRRPLKQGEIQQYISLYEKVAESDADFERGISMVAKAMLVSPHFLFRIETSRPIDGVTAINDYELASRLSYLIWSSMPDNELLRLAEKGRLSAPGELASQVQRMLADERADSLAKEFVDQWLFSHVTQREPDPVVFPTYTPEVAEAARQELNWFIMALLREDRSLIELLDSDYTFANETLADHYKIEGVEGEEFRRVALSPEHRRGGLLGMTRVLQRTSMADRTSPTVRGAWVLDAILGTPPPPPPPDVNNSLSQEDSRNQESLTFRQKVELHASDSSVCAGCHKKMDPLGFAMDNYDGIGQWRTDSEGQALDTTGTMTDGRELTGIDDLKEVLLERKDQFARNLAERLLVYALGRELTGDDFSSVNAIVKQIVDNDYRASSMVMAIVQSYPFNHKKHPSAVIANGLGASL